MANRMERKDIEEERAKLIKYNRSYDESYQGWTNWDTWDTALIMDNYEPLYRSKEAWSKNFNNKLRSGTFDMDQAEKAVKKYLLPEIRKQDPDIDPNKVNYKELVMDIVQEQDTPGPRKKDYVPLPVGTDYQDSYIKEECERMNMEYVPGYRKADGTMVQAYCRHTKYTEFMKKYGGK